MKPTNAAALPKCPHPSGTSEYENWWRLHFARVIPIAVAEMRSDEAARRRCERAGYGHRFDRDTRCACGMTEINLLVLTPDERWQGRARLICPLLIGPKETPVKTHDMCGADLIKQERLDQIHLRGYDAASDDEHTDGALLHAALLILLDETGHTLVGVDEPDKSGPWPDQLVLKLRDRDDPLRALTVAGSLIAAEIDRLQRREEKT